MNFIKERYKELYEIEMGVEWSGEREREREDKSKNRKVGFKQIR
jgi:hypothetical protein